MLIDETATDTVNSVTRKVSSRTQIHWHLKYRRSGKVVEETQFEAINHIAGSVL